MPKLNSSQRRKAFENKQREALKSILRNRETRGPSPQADNENEDNKENFGGQEMSQASICGSLDSNVEPNPSEEEGNNKPAEIDDPTDNATMITMKHVGHNPSYEKTTDAPLTFQGRVAPLDRAEEEDRSSVYAAIQAEFDNAFATEYETSNNTNESITTKEKRFLHLLQLGASLNRL